MDDLVSRLLEAIGETERLARAAQHPDAPESGEHWHWVHHASECPKVDMPADLDAVEVYLGEDVEYGWKVDLRSVEQYSTAHAYTLPHFVVQFAEEQAVGPARHIIRHDPSSVLRSCAADRKQVDLHGIVHRDIGWLEWDEGEHAEMYAELPVCGLCVPRHSSFPRREDIPEGPCRTVRILAEGYGLSDHQEGEE